VAANQKLSKETAAELEKPILQKEMHVELSNKRWDEAIRSGKKVWKLEDK
jgi:hypothetical protein